MIFQGEDQTAFNNTLIGKLPILLPEAREEGYYQFEVTFSLNNDGLLHVGVKEARSQKDWETHVQCSVRSDEKQINKSAEELARAFGSRPLPTPGSASSQEQQGSASALPKPPASLPRPPAGIPRPPQRETVPPTPVAQPANPTPSTNAPAIPLPPENTPEQFKSIVRRSYKQINQLALSPQRDALLVAYRAFVQAVEANSPDLIDLGDDLEDIYIRTR
jgi:molecular chaperone DnaK